MTTLCSTENYKEVIYKNLDKDNCRELIPLYMEIISIISQSRNITTEEFKKYYKIQNFTGIISTV